MIIQKTVDPQTRFKGVFYKFFTNLGRIFARRNLIWHVAAIVLTYLIAVSGWDWKYYLIFRNTLLYPLSFSAAVIGGILPLILPLAVYVRGRLKSDIKLANAGLALIQAGVLSSLISSAYKSLTGRSYPPQGQLGLLVDSSRMFNFSFFHNQVFWGWPSSHTTIAFAMAVTLAVLYSSNKKIVYFAWVYAFYIGLFVAISIHWFSDFVAGAIIGTVIGSVVGRSFKDRISIVVPTRPDKS